MGAIVALGKRVPEDIRMVGVDDVSYAKYLPTPLTTLRQDCAEIGAVAMSVMLERIKRPNHPVMDVRVKTELVVRASCGTAA
jgi:DNA-binding LacI/PurR family transcriptional regulator